MEWAKRSFVKQLSDQRMDRQTAETERQIDTKAATGIQKETLRHRHRPTLTRIKLCVCIIT